MRRAWRSRIGDGGRRTALCAVLTSLLACTGCGDKGAPQAAFSLASVFGGIVVDGAGGAFGSSRVPVRSWQLVASMETPGGRVSDVETIENRFFRSRARRGMPSFDVMTRGCVALIPAGVGRWVAVMLDSPANDRWDAAQWRPAGRSSGPIPRASYPTIAIWDGRSLTEVLPEDVGTVLGPGFGQLRLGYRNVETPKVWRPRTGSIWSADDVELRMLDGGSSRLDHTNFVMREF